MRIRFALLGLLLLTACGRESSGPYPLVGAFMDYNETFKGAVRVNFSTATSCLTVDTTNSKIHGEGLSRVTDRSGLLRACNGYRGIAALQCNDGRHLSADWTASSCTSGAGEGTDDNGTVFGFIFGMSPQEADDDLARLKTGVAQKPALPGYREAWRKGGSGSGTGFLISKDGLVATNFHVVDGASSIEIYQAGRHTAQPSSPRILPTTWRFSKPKCRDSRSCSVPLAPLSVARM